MMVHIQNNEELNESEFRIMVMNAIRKNVAQFKKEYGRDVVIACDTHYSWRKEWFPHYKSSRRKMRDDSPIDWEEIFVYFNRVKSELQEYTNYKVIEVDRAEADDVIAYFVNKNGVFLGQNDPIVIVSGDKDFVQLQKYSNVYQYDPVNKKQVTKGDANLYLIDHMIRGDRGDGIPNCLSDDDTFVTDKRQVVMTKKRYTALYDAAMAGTLTSPGYIRNRVLIDLANTPQSVKDAIQVKYDSENSKEKKSLMTYFAKYRMKSLIEYINDF